MILAVWVLGGVYVAAVVGFAAWATVDDIRRHRAAARDGHAAPSEGVTP